MKESNSKQTCWEAVAEAWRIDLPPDRLRAILPALATLTQDTRRCLDRDLSGLEPAFVFRAADLDGER